MRLLPGTDSEHRRATLVVAVLALMVSLGAVVVPLLVGPSTPKVTIAWPTPPPTPGNGGASACFASTEEGNQSGGWGPERPTFGGESLPAYNTFDVVRDNPTIGDERAFVGIEDAAVAGSGGWRKRLEMEPAKSYLIRVYVHNGASATAGQVATGVRVMFNLPICTGHSILLAGFIDSGDAFPQQVYSEVTVWARSDFNLVYIADSARYETNKSPLGGFPVLGETGLFTSKGALIGYDKLDGSVPGGEEYGGYLTFRIRPQFAG